MNIQDIKIGLIVKKPSTYKYRKGSNALDTYLVIGFTKKRVRVQLLAIDNQIITKDIIESFSATSFTEIVKGA